MIVSIKIQDGQVSNERRIIFFFKDLHYESIVSDISNTMADIMDV
jgi:hypothetical protein